MECWDFMLTETAFLYFLPEPHGRDRCVQLLDPRRDGYSRRLERVEAGKNAITGRRPARLAVDPIVVDRQIVEVVPRKRGEIVVGIADGMALFRCQFFPVVEFGDAFFKQFAGEEEIGPQPHEFDGGRFVEQPLTRGLNGCPCEIDQQILQNLDPEIGIVAIPESLEKGFGCRERIDIRKDVQCIVALTRYRKIRCSRRPARRRPAGNRSRSGPVRLRHKIREIPIVNGDELGDCLLDFQLSRQTDRVGK